jgi:hypothetical protein
LFGNVVTARIRRFELFNDAAKRFISLTHFEPCGGHGELRDKTRETTMADRSALKLVGFIFATVTLAVMLATGMVVKGYADGAYSIDGMMIASR